MATDQRRKKRQPISYEAMAYDNQGAPIVACSLRDVSEGGAQLKLASEVEMPPRFTLALTHGGEVKRRCVRAWQSATAVGVRFEMS
jgi:hypothetical protein